MTLTPGTRLGPYEILSAIGAGGMGEVYRATDTNLKRAVAIKVLPASLANDADRLARFQREAEVLAALNHPNIAQIHGLERADGMSALVMELVDGLTLADRLAQGPIPVEEALPIARQIAEALEAAHEHGIVHRDLKPANIKVRDDVVGSAVSPFASPDGLWLGFVAVGGIELKKVAITGGPPIAICTLSAAMTGASWGPDDTIVFADRDTGTGLWRVSAAGGNPELITKPDAARGEADHTLPEILPDGRHVLFTILAPGGQAENAQIALLDLETRQYRVLIRGGSNPRFAVSGHIVYAAAGSLRAVAFDARRLELTGSAVPVVERVVTKPSGAASFSIARNGTLAYISGNPVGTSRRTLVWVDRKGREEPLGVPDRAYAYPRISPDGARIALDVRDQENDIWIWDVTRKTLTRLTFDPGLNRGGVWSPDGRKIAFSARQPDGTENLYWQAPEGTGVPERLTEGSDPQVPISFAPDGSRLLFSEPGPPQNIGVANLQGDRRTELLIGHPQFSEHNPEVAPNGRWIAYQSDESGRDQVYVRPFPDVERGRWMVSTEGGNRPLWARNGRELFYLAGDHLMAVPIDESPAFVHGTPYEVIKVGQYLAPQTGRTYDVSLDGSRFLMIKEAEQRAKTEPNELVVVLNWTDELKRLVPRN